MIYILLLSNLTLIKIWTGIKRDWSRMGRARDPVLPNPDQVSVRIHDLPLPPGRPPNQVRRKGKIPGNLRPLPTPPPPPPLSSCPWFSI